MNKETKQRLREYMKLIIGSAFNRISEIESEYLDEEEWKNKNPFLSRITPVEVSRAARFERVINNKMAQGVYENIAKIIVEGTGAKAIIQYEKTININTWRIEKISEILKEDKKRRLKDASNMPNWSREINEVLALTNPRFEAITIKSDLYICRQDGAEEFYFFRGVKPNRDQVTGVKEDMLKLNAVNNEYKTYFALPYNPSGQDGGYKEAHGLPYTILNMDEDPVLIGADLWNKLGQNDNTYNELLQIFEEIGGDYTKAIKEKLSSMTQTLIITEGKTDWKHLKNALRVFQENSKFRGIDIEFLEYESEQEMGDAQLIKLLKEIAKVPHENKIIGIFDRDAENGKKISKTGLFKYFGNNVYGFSIPTPSFREYHSGICIEFLYKNEDLLREDKEGKRLYLSSEFSGITGRLTKNSDINYTNVNKLKNKTIAQNEIIIDDDVYNKDAEKVTISKNIFAEYILSQKGSFKEADITGFEGVFEVIQEILLQ